MDSGLNAQKLGTTDRGAPSLKEFLLNKFLSLSFVGPSFSLEVLVVTGEEYLRFRFPVGTMQRHLVQFRL